MSNEKDPSRVRKIIRGLSDSANDYLQRALNGGDDTIPEATLQDSESAQLFSAESNATAQLYDVASTLEAVGTQPRHLATVLAVGETSSPQHLTFTGERVRVLRSTLHPQLVDQCGYAMPEPQQQDKRFVVFSDGQHGSFTLLAHTDAAPDATEAVLAHPPHVRSAFVGLDGRYLEITIPESVTVLPGDTVQLTAQGNFVGVAAWNTSCGEIAVVEEITSDDTCIVRITGAAQKSVTIRPSAKPIALGQRVVLDRTGNIALRNLGMVETGYHFTEQPTETWAQVIGQAAAVKALQRALRPIKIGDAGNALRRKARKGGILIGPPGCGKTHLARAAANECGSLFFYIKAPELFRSLVGEAEALLRHVIRRGEAYFTETGKRPIIFLDEVDGIAKTRGTNLSSDAAETILLTLMTEMNDSHAFFLAATNRIDTIDPALLRPGRLTLKLYVGRPDQQAAEMLFTLYLTGVTTAGHTVEELARLATAELYSTRYPLYNLNVTPVDGNPQEISFGLQDVASGALINEGIIEQAKEISEDEADATNSPEALTLQHLKEAITLVYHGEQQVNHRQAIEEYAEQRYPDAGIGVTRLYQKQK